MTGEADNRSGKSRQAKAPISSHPAFPAIVALWFAALLGLGSLILPVALLETFSRAANLAAIAPAAAPPFGITARIVIAALAGIIGIILGLLIAYRVRSLQADEAAHERDPLAPLLRPVDSHPDAPSKRPIFAHAELGSQRFDGPVDADADSPDEDFAPGDQPGADEIDQAGIAADDEGAEDGATDDSDLLDLDIFAGPHEPASGLEAASPDPAQEARPARDEKPFERMSLAELVDRFARSLQSHERPDPAGDTAPLRAALPDWNSSPDVPETEGDWTEGDWTGGTPDHSDSESSLYESEQDAIAATEADYIPAAMRPLVLAEDNDEDEDENAEDGWDIDEDEDEDSDGFSSLLAMRPSLDTARQTIRIDDEAAPDDASVDVDTDTDTDTDNDADAFAEPVVNFPASPPYRRDAAASEKALRDALDKLQRMSGAA